LVSFIALKPAKIPEALSYISGSAVFKRSF
jgi:hypothetical protein